MANSHVDAPGEIQWFKGYGPQPVLGPCYHTRCDHFARSVIAYGPSYERYVLVQCDGRSRPAKSAPSCQGWCRAWLDDQGNVVTPWLAVKVPLCGDPCT